MHVHCDLSFNIQGFFWPPCPFPWVSSWLLLGWQGWRTGPAAPRRFSCPGARGWFLRTLPPGLGHQMPLGGKCEVHPVSFFRDSAGDKKGVLQLEAPGTTLTLQRSHPLSLPPWEEGRSSPSLGHLGLGELDRGEMEGRPATCCDGGSHHWGWGRAEAGRGVAC